MTTQEIIAHTQEIIAHLEEQRAELETMFWNARSESMINMCEIAIECIDSRLERERAKL